jgi:hypothetical protein
MKTPSAIMRATKRTSLAIIITIFAWYPLFDTAKGHSEAAQPSSNEISEMINQMGGLLGNLKEIDQDLAKNQRDKQAMDKNEKARLTEEARIYDADRLKVMQRYPEGKIVSHEEKIRGEAAIDAINTRHDITLQKLQALKARYDANDREKTKLLRNKSWAEGQLKATRRILSRLSAFDDCQNEPTLEAIHQCMQNKWDGARPSYSMDPAVVKAEWKAKPMTQEEVIELYKKSGRANLGPSLKINEVPSPPNQ